MGGSPKLFERRDAVGASGRVLPWVIDVDAIPDDVINEIADIAAPLLPTFGRVVGVPKGSSPKSRDSLDNGRRLEIAFRTRVTHGSPMTLIVDDVWTTGGSMRAFARETKCDWVGFVVYSRVRVKPGSNVWAFWEFGL